MPMEPEFLEQLDQEALLSKITKDEWGNDVAAPPVVLEHVHFTETVETMGTGGTKGASIDAQDDVTSSPLLIVDYDIPVELKPGDMITDPSSGFEYIVGRVTLYHDPENHEPHHYEAEMSEKE